MTGPNYRYAFAELVKGINLDTVKKGLGNEAKDLFEKIAAEFAKNIKGAYVNDDVKLRAYRVAYEREIGMREDFIKKSNELFEADLKLQKTKFKAGKGTVPYYRPGHISSADDLIARTKRAEAWLADKRRSKFAKEKAQRVARDRRLQELSPDDTAAIHRYKEQYGAGWRDVALKEYRDLMMSIRSPEQYARLQAIRQWGTDLPVTEAQDIEYGRRLKATTAHTSAEKREVRIDAYASSMGRRNAEKLVDAEDAERRRASRSERRKEQLSGYFAYKRDMFMSGLDEREQFAYAHAKQYGGGAKGRERARDVWNRQFLAEFKWLKPLAKNSTFINKHLPSIAKGLGAAGKLPFGIGRLVTNPYSAILAGMATYGNFKSEQYLAARNAQKVAAVTAMVGNPPPEFKKAAANLGLNLDQTAQEYLNIIKTYGSLDAIKSFSRIPSGIAKTSIAESLGLSPSALAILDQMSGVRTGHESGASMAQAIDDLEKYGWLKGTSLDTKLIKLLPSSLRNALIPDSAIKAAAGEARAVVTGKAADLTAAMTDEEVIEHYSGQFGMSFATGMSKSGHLRLDGRATAEEKRRLREYIEQKIIERSRKRSANNTQARNAFTTTYNEAVAVAESADSFEASLRESGTTVASITKGGDTISIDTVVLRDVRNLDDFMNEVKRVAGGESIVASSDTLRMMDPGMI